MKHARWLGLAPATLEFWVRFPNERNQGKQAHPVLKYRFPHGSQSSTLLLPHAHSFVIGPAVINTHKHALRNTMVSRTNNTYTSPTHTSNRYCRNKHTLPRQILCQSCHAPVLAHVHAYPCDVWHQFRILMNLAASSTAARRECLAQPRTPG